MTGDAGYELMKVGWMPYDRERSTAIEAVLKACRLCEAVRADLVSEETLAKRDRSPVTVADFGAQAVICSGLERAFPDDPIVAEEDSVELRSAGSTEIRAKVVERVSALLPGSMEEEVLAAIDRGGYSGGPEGRHWTLDPIDGTKGFLRNEQYAVALALIEDGEVVLGVLGCPNLPIDAGRPEAGKGCLFIASRGQGARMRPFVTRSERRIQVSTLEDPAEAAFCESVEAAHSSQDHAARVAAALGVEAPPLRMDSQAKYAAVARGDAAIYLRLPTGVGYVEKIWDHAAGSILIQEAGGEVTDALGKPLDFSAGRTLERNTGVVATNGWLHPQVIAAVRQVLT
jgi:3'(2'), 5'-bisphosphate nucleotidase